MAFEIGQQAPAFSLPDQDGNLVRSEEFYGQKPLVIFFYPRDFTPICTLENQAFRDHYDDFVALGADILGVSADSADSHCSFRNEKKLPYRLLTDVGNKVRDQFGGKGFFGSSGRVTYALDKGGKILDIFSSPIRANEHVKRALSALA